MFLSGWLSGLKPRARSTRRARPRHGPLGGIRDWLLEDRCLLAIVPPVPVPGGSNTALNQIFWNGGAAPLNPPPVSSRASPPPRR